jgi:hypothetical protein
VVAYFPDGKWAAASGEEPSTIRPWPSSEDEKKLSKR